MTENNGKRSLAVIPCYNEERTIGSVILQAKKHVDDVLVIDDGSSDGTGKIAKNAGAKVQIECNCIINKVSTIPVGGAITTSGGKLTSKNIIHANNSSRDKKSLMKATWNALKIANKKKFRKIVFSSITEDILGFTPRSSANIMIPTIKKFILEQNKNIEQIYICLDNLPDYKEFEKALK